MQKLARTEATKEQQARLQKELSEPKDETVIPTTQEEREKVFLRELEREIKFEWHWERRASNRWDWMTNLTVVSKAIALSCTSVLLYLHGKPHEAEVTIPLLFLSAACMLGSILFPQYASTYKLPQRQEVHDQNARDYSIIHTKYVGGELTFQQAMEQFVEIRKQSVEAKVRRTP